MREGVYICDQCGRPAISAFNLNGERHLVFDPIAKDDPTLFAHERPLAAFGTMVRARKCGTFVRSHEGSHE